MRKEQVKDDLQSLLFVVVLACVIIFSIIYRIWFLLGIISTGIVLIGLLCFILSVALRQHYGMDFIGSFKKLILFFKRRGYEVTEYFKPGSAHPGVTLYNPMGKCVKIIFNDRFFGKNFIEVRDNCDATKSWRFDRNNYNDIELIEKMLSSYFGNSAIEDEKISYNRLEKYIMSYPEFK